MESEILGMICVFINCALYGYLISAWISGDALVEREKDKRDSSKGDLESDGTSKATNADERPPPKWVEEFRVRLVGVADEIHRLGLKVGIYSSAFTLSLDIQRWTCRTDPPDTN